MDNAMKRSRGFGLPIALLALLVALAAAVSAYAGSGPAATTDAASPAQWQTLPVQESQATPAPESGERRGPGDCPERGGDGGGNGSAPESQSTPEASTSTPSPEV